MVPDMLGSFQIECVQSSRSGHEPGGCSHLYHESGLVSSDDPLLFSGPVLWFGLMLEI
jgi:hypothetical protein